MTASNNYKVARLKVFLGLKPSNCSIGFVGGAMCIYAIRIRTTPGGKLHFESVLLTIVEFL